MLYRTEAIGKLEKIFILYILVNPLFDIIGGLFIEVFKASFPVTPGTLIRGLFLLFMVFYLFRERERLGITLLFLMGIVWCLSLTGQLIMKTNRSVLAEVQYFARYVYNVAIIFVYEIVSSKYIFKDRNWKYTFYSCIVFAGLITAFVINLSFLMGVGLSTYEGESGVKGLFYGGNDITAVLSIVFPLSIYRFVTVGWLEKSRLHRAVHFIAPSMIATALVLITTRIAYGVVVAGIISFGIYLAFRGTRQEKMKYILMLATIIIMVVSIHFTPSGMSSFENSLNRQRRNIEARQDDVMSYILSSRNHMVKQVYKEYSQGNLFVKLFGVGRGSQEHTIEMDAFEIFFYYGIIGFLILSYPYFKRGFSILRHLLSNFNLEAFTLFLSIGVGVGSSFFAGHVLFSATAGIYLSLLVAYVFFASEDSSLLQNFFLTPGWGFFMLTIAGYHYFKKGLLGAWRRGFSPIFLTCYLSLIIFLICSQISCSENS